MSETTQEVSQKEPQIERRREEKDSKFKELKTKAQMAKFEQSAEQTALAAITIPLFRFFTCAQIFFTIFAAYAGIPTRYLAVYIFLAALSAYINLRYENNYQFVANYIHAVVIFHGIFGVILYGWNCGCENFLIWGIATSYLIFIGKNRTVLTVIILEAVAYVLLYLFRENFGVVNLSPYDHVVFITVFICIFVSFLRRTSTLNSVYAKSINELALQNDKLESASKFDFLTGLDNRRYAQEQFDEIATHFPHQKVLVALGDIDDFKAINDTFGHKTGDETIRAIGRILRENSRDEKDIVCRWGGEEFLLLALVNDEISAQAILKRALKKVNTLSSPDGKKIGITFGAAMFDNARVTTLGEMADVADELLYEGKRSGKNRINFKGYGDAA